MTGSKSRIMADVGGDMPIDEEMGHFQLGSTVIILFTENKIGWSETVKAKMALKMGEKIGSIL